MIEPAGTVAWIAIAPVKSMALEFLDGATLGLAGIPGDRAFAVVDEASRLVNGKRAGSLATVRVHHDPRAGRLTLTLPDETVVDGEVVRGSELEVRFSSRRRLARLVCGPWNEALSSWSGHPLRLVALPPGAGADRGPTATLVSTAALGALAQAGGASEPLDRRRFRMTFGIDGVPAFAEDDWIGRDIAVGEAVIRIAGNVGRCAVTTHDPDTGRASWDTLHVLQHSRGQLPSSEPLPFGVWAEIVRAGHVALGDPVGGIGPDTAQEY